MGEIGELFELQLMMFFLMAVGYVLKVRGIITPEGRSMLTDLIINVILPCNIISSFSVSLDAGIIKAGIQVLMISTGIQLLCSLISAFCYRKVPKHQRVILQYGTVSSNSGFLGNPVAEGLYGSLGLLYASIYLIPQRIVMWSAGVSYFTESPSKKEVFIKVMKHPCIIAVEIGLFLMLTQIQLPGFLSRGIRSLGGCTTAITMLFIGVVLADSGLKNLISRTTIFYCIIRLLLIPAIVMVGCLILSMDATAAGLSVVLAAMPMASTTAILATKYHGDEKFASQCIVVSTVLSMAILPVWCTVLNYFF